LEQVPGRENRSTRRDHSTAPAPLYQSRSTRCIAREQAAGGCAEHPKSALCCSLLGRVLFDLVPDDDPLVQVDDSLGNIAGMVGDSLEMATDAHQLQPGVELAGIVAQ